MTFYWSNKLCFWHVKSLKNMWFHSTRATSHDFAMTNHKQINDFIRSQPKQWILKVRWQKQWLHCTNAKAPHPGSNTLFVTSRLCNLQWPFFGVQGYLIATVQFIQISSACPFTQVTSSGHIVLKLTSLHLFHVRYYMW